MLMLFSASQTINAESQIFYESKQIVLFKTLPVETAVSYLQCFCKLIRECTPQIHVIAASKFRVIGGVN